MSLAGGTEENLQKVAFLKTLLASFNASELQEICLELEVDYEILSGTSKADKARELILYLDRRGRLVQLSQLCHQLRPESSWQSTEPARSRSYPLNSLIRVLFLSADPVDRSRLRLGEEVREIRERLQLVRSRERFELHPRMCARTADISQALLDIKPKIVHISGHGDSAGGLCFETQTGQTHTVAPDALARLFGQFANQVDCVVLSSCYSEAQARRIAEHIQYVIGMNRAVDDRSAIAFCIGFYQALGAGRNVEEAFELGTLQISLSGACEHLAPVLLKRSMTRQ